MHTTVNAHDETTARRGTPTPPLLVALVALLGLALLSAVWTVQAAAATGDLGAQHRVSHAGPDTDTAFEARDADTAYDPGTGRHLMVWQGETSVNGENEIFGRLVDTDGKPLADEFRISSMGPEGDLEFDALDPKVVFNPTADEYLVTWAADDDTGSQVNGEFEIYVQRLSSAGAELGADDQRISSMGPTGDVNFGAANPAVAYNSAANEYLVTWSGEDKAGALDDGEIELFEQRLTITGSETGPDDLRITSIGPDGDDRFSASQPSAVYNGVADEYLVAWQSKIPAPAPAGIDTEIQVRRLSSSGTPVGSGAQTVSTMGPDNSSNTQASDPALAYNPDDNEYLVAWHGNDGDPLAAAELEIYAQRLTGAGAEIGPDDLRVSSMGPDGDATFVGSDAAVAYSPEAREYLVAWYGDDQRTTIGNGELEIFGQRLSRAGAEVGPDDRRLTTVGPDGAEFNAQDPALGYDPDNERYLIAWEGDDDSEGQVLGELEISLRTMDATGVPAPGPGPTPGPGPGADTAVSGANVKLRKRIVVKGRQLKVKIGSGAAEETANVATATLIERPTRRGKRSAGSKKRRTQLRTATGNSEADERTTLRSRFKGGKKKRQRLTKKLVRRLQAGEVKARLRVEVTLTDAAGNSVVEKRAAKVRAPARRSAAAHGRS